MIKPKNFLSFSSNENLEEETAINLEGIQKGPYEFCKTKQWLRKCPRREVKAMCF